MPDLFSPLRLPGLELPNRIMMAPMTRGRAGQDHVANAMMAEYYATRANAGLLITEASCVSPRARGWNAAPYIYTAEQVAGWRQVTDAVHAAGGRIHCQIWFIGRVSHPDFLDGELPWAPSADRVDHHVHVPSGESKSCVTPHEMTKDDIATAIADYRHGAKMALEAGFDGVQLHAANGYLVDQFLRDSTNGRADEYGGSVSNRLRFLKEVVEALCREIGGSKLSVRLSPRNKYNDIDDSDPAALFGAAAEALNIFDLSFLEIMEALPGHFLHQPGAPILPIIRSAFNGVLVANGGYDRYLADAAIAKGEIDAISFGMPFLANADLVARLRSDAPLNTPDFATFYTPGEQGYLDYPTLTPAR